MASELDKKIAKYRKELFQWERYFQQKYGRRPGVKDIQERPQNYKNYNRLKKQKRAEAEEGGVSAHEAHGKTAQTTAAKEQGAQEEKEEGQEPVNGEEISTQQSQMDTPPPVQYHGQQRRKPSVQVIAGDEADEFLSKLGQEKIDSDLANEAFWLDISVEELIARKEAGSSQSQSQSLLQSPDDPLGPSSAPDPFHQPLKEKFPEAPLSAINTNANIHTASCSETKSTGKRRASQSVLDDTATAAAAVHAHRERRMFRFKHSRSFHELTEDDGQHDEAYRAFFLGLTVKELRAREGRSKKRSNRTATATSGNQENKPALKRSANSAPSTHEVIKQQEDKEEEEKKKKEDFAKAMSVMEAVANTMLPADVKVVPRTSRRYMPSTPYTSYQVERIQNLLRDHLFFEERVTPVSDEHLTGVHDTSFAADHYQVNLRQEETFS
ncbi:hypothetical protein BCR43DRAFT_521809 [Syncephalastrum racemosum]|uniref:DNA replication regulator SLD2 n=1 Tax=Syncephalastrum racemosum TaxID=13706 RepID=A0A1X2HNF5_SYNRA|nr:hypothetical protein BCR43DRAFT_521809 [Syncephalastrum racemosum]